MISSPLRRSFFPSLSILLAILSHVYSSASIADDSNNSTSLLVAGNTTVIDPNVTTAALDARPPVVENGKSLSTVQSNLTNLTFSNTQEWEPELLKASSFFSDAEHGV